MKSVYALLAMSLLLAPMAARAEGAEGVGLGVAAGADVYRLKAVADSDAEFQLPSLSWGFFVDIPLLSTFYITPAAMLYELDFGDDRRYAVTDIDLNFKFLIPIGAFRLGAGLTGGLTTGLGDYVGHYGLLAYFSFNLVSNLDVFALAQWKRVAYGTSTIDNIHGYLGGMFRF